MSRQSASRGVAPPRDRERWLSGRRPAEFDESAAHPVSEAVLAAEEPPADAVESDLRGSRAAMHAGSGAPGEVGRTPIASLSNGRLMLSLGTVGCMAAAAFVCVVALAGYSAGRRAAGVPAAASALEAVRPARNPLLSSQRPAGPPAGTRVERESGDADLARLMESPAVRAVSPPPAAPRSAERAEQGGAAAAPARASANRPGTIGVRPLQFLQIESFRGAKGSARPDVLAEVRDVRRFLSQRGVETKCRETTGGFVLVSARGFEPRSPEMREFQRKIEQYGREYRRSGGRYEFKGCFFIGEGVLPGEEIE